MAVRRSRAGLAASPAGDPGGTALPSSMQPRWFIGVSFVVARTLLSVGKEIRDVVQALPAATSTALVMCDLACGVGSTHPRDVRLVGLFPRRDPLAPSVQTPLSAMYRVGVTGATTKGNM